MITMRVFALLLLLTPEPTYADAYARALATGKPLVVWQGAAVHRPSIAATADEWINFVGDAPGCSPNAITVGVPEGEDIWRVEAISDWQTGDARLGHAPSVRRAIAKWRDLRSLAESPAQVMPIVDGLKSRKSTGYGGIYPGIGPAYLSVSEASPTFRRP